MNTQIALRIKHYTKFNPFLASNIRCRNKYGTCQVANVGFLFISSGLKI